MPLVFITRAIRCAGCGDDEIPDAVTRIRIGDVACSPELHGKRCGVVYRQIQLATALTKGGPAHDGFVKLRDACLHHMDWSIEVDADV